jgi:hypothetical protein
MDGRCSSFERQVLKRRVTLIIIRFINPQNEKYILKQDYKIDVPADGLPTYAESIWDTIQSEKDLDLPSQRHMLAVFRCDEIAKVTFDNPGVMNPPRKLLILL